MSSTETSRNGRGEESPRNVPALYVLGIVLVLALVLLNVALAANATVFDEEHTIETLDSAGVYDEVTLQLQTEVTVTINDTVEQKRSELSEEEQLLIEEWEQQQNSSILERQRQEEIAEGSITTEYVEGELNRIIGLLYASLDGEESDERIALDLRAPRDDISTELSREEPPGMDVGAAVRSNVPDEKNLTENGDMPGEFENGQDAASITNTLVWLLPLLSIGFLAGMFHFSGRELHSTAKAAGLSMFVAGIAGVGVGSLAGAYALPAIEPVTDVESAAVEPIVSAATLIIENCFEMIRSQSVVLAIVGVLVLGIAVVSENGYLDGLLGDDDPKQQGASQQEPQAKSRTSTPEQVQTQTESEPNIGGQPAETAKQTPQTEGQSTESTSQDRPFENPSAEEQSETTADSQGTDENVSGEQSEQKGWDETDHEHHARTDDDGQSETEDECQARTDQEEQVETDDEGQQAESETGSETPKQLDPRDIVDEADLGESEKE